MKQEKLRLEDYPFTIRPLTNEDGGGYLIEFPDVPGCISDGEAPEEAIANGRDALKSALLTMKEFGDRFRSLARARPPAGNGGNVFRNRSIHGLPRERGKRGSASTPL